MRYEKLAQIAKGWSSYIWLAEAEEGKLKGSKVILKEVREKSPRKDLAHREGGMLLRANSTGVGPKVVEVNYKKNFVAMEYIEGPKLVDWILGSGGATYGTSPTEHDLYFFIKELYKQCLALDSIGLSHNQLQVGKNILVRKEGKHYLPVIIDFEKATMKTPETTKNVGQIFSFLFYNPNGAVAKKVREKLGLSI